MGFFRSLNFPRGVILISLLASSAFGWLVYEKTEQLEEIKRHLEVNENKKGQLSQVEQLVKLIQTRGIELDNLQKSASGELLKGEAALTAGSVSASGFSWTRFMRPVSTSVGGSTTSGSTPRSTTCS